MLPVDLRDYFAGQALAGLIVGAPVGGHESGAAAAAYLLADAMLKAREARHV